MRIYKNPIIVYISIASSTLLLLPFSVRLTSISTVLILTYWIFEGKFKEKIKLLKERKLAIIALVFFSIYVLSLFYTNNLKAGWFNIEKRVSLLIFPLVFGSIDIPTQYVKRLMKVFILSLVLTCFYGIFKATMFYNLPTEHFRFIHLPHALSSYIGFHTPYLAMYLSLASFFCIFFIIRGDKKWIYLFIFLLFNIYLLILSSRTAIAAYFFIIFIFSVYYFIKGKKISLIFISIIVLSGILYGSYLTIPRLKERMDRITEKGEGGYERMIIWRVSLQIFIENPLIGISPGDLKEYQIGKYQEKRLDSRFYQYNPHSEYIFTLASLGAIGFIILMTMLISSLIHAWQYNKYLYLSFLVLFILCFVTEVLLARQKGVVLFSLFNSLFAFSNPLSQKTM